MGGGLAIAWFTQGSLFYEYQVKSITAKVVANAPGSLAKTEEDKRHYLVVAFDECPDVRQGLRVPPATGVKKEYAALAAKLRSCLLPFKPGDRVALDVKLRRARLSGQRNWRINGLDHCDVEPLETTVEATDQTTRCAWM